MKTNIFKTTGIQLPDQIAEVPLSSAHNAQHVQFHVSILSFFSEEEATQLDISDLRAYYKGLYDKEDAAFKQTQMYEPTKQIKQLDMERDNIYRFIRDTVKTNLRALDMGKRQSAEHLEYVMKNYAKSDAAPYSEETALLENMIQDLEEGSTVVLVANLGLTDTVAKLKDANSRFNEVYSSRIDDKVARAAIDNMKTVRPQVDEAYRAVVQILNARHTTNELAATPDIALRSTLLTLISGINGQIVQMRENIAAVSKTFGEKEDGKEK